LDTSAPFFAADQGLGGSTTDASFMKNPMYDTIVVIEAGGFY